MAAESPSGAASLIVQLVPFFFFNLLLIVPFIRILRRAGRSGWWALLLLIPTLGWVILPWVIAFMRWERPVGEIGEVFR